MILKEIFNYKEYLITKYINLEIFKWKIKHHTFFRTCLVENKIHISFSFYLKHSVLSRFWKIWRSKFLLKNLYINRRSIQISFPR